MSTAVIPAPKKFVEKTDIVNNLTSTATDQPLSAAQGKALNDAMPKIIGIGGRTDSAGSFTVDKAMDRLIAVNVNLDSCYTILCRLNSTKTQVYVRSISTNDPVVDTAYTGIAAYFN